MLRNESSPSIITHYAGVAIDGLFSFIGCWIMLALLIYLKQHRALCLSTKVDKFILYRMMMCASCFFLSSVIIQMMSFIAPAVFQRSCDSSCEISMDVAITCLQMTFSTSYIYLWIRLRYYYCKHVETFSKQSKCFPVQVWLCLFYIVFWCMLTTALVFGVDTYQCIEDACQHKSMITGNDTVLVYSLLKLINPPEQYCPESNCNGVPASYFYIATFFLFLFGNLSTSFSLLHLTTGVMIAQKQPPPMTRKQKRLSTCSVTSGYMNSQNKLKRRLKKVVFCTIICVISDDLCFGLFAYLASIGLVSNITVLPLNLTVLFNILVLICSFSSNSCLLLFPFYSSREILL